MRRLILKSTSHMPWYFEHMLGGKLDERIDLRSLKSRAPCYTNYGADLVEKIHLNFSKCKLTCALMFWIHRPNSKSFCLLGSNDSRNLEEEKPISQWHLTPLTNELQLGLTCATYWRHLAKSLPLFIRLKKISFQTISFWCCSLFAAQGPAVGSADFSWAG